MGDDLAVVSLDLKGTDTMEQSPARRPKLDLLNESEEGYLLPIIDFFWSLLCHSDAFLGLDVNWRGVRELHPATQI